MNARSFLSRRTVSVCHACRRSLAHRYSTSPRTLAASYQAYPLPRQTPPQPRNASVPDTSIAHPVQPLPRVHETRPPGEESVGVSIPEGQAQHSDPSFAQSSAVLSSIQQSSTQQAQTQQHRPTPSSPSSASPDAASAPQPRRSKLRTPRKAAMKLTPAAVDQLRAMLEGPDPKIIKVGVRNRGCSGLAYHLEYVDRPGTFDEAVEQDGVKVLVDSKALFSIIGSEMDWVEDKLNERFVFRNPNIKEQCGCGESFMV